MSGQFRPVNYRDVGEALGLWLEPSPVPEGRLLRGGKFDQLAGVEDLGNPRTILNLRRGPDPRHMAEVAYLHVAAANDQENYDTTHKGVRAWLGKVLEVLADPGTAWPVYLHCTSGRDRTGIVVAAALSLIEVPRSVIVEEFLLSDGAEQACIERALDGLGTSAAGLGVDRRRLREALCG
ncbi:MAG: tyrosine-protein phosphatase [Polyangiaceae bacterium]